MCISPGKDEPSSQCIVQNASEEIETWAKITETRFKACFIWGSNVSKVSLVTN